MKHLTAVLLSCLLVGCSTTQHHVPSEWLAPTASPQRSIVTNKDLVLWLKDYQAALKSCNGDKDDIRQLLGE